MGIVFFSVLPLTGLEDFSFQGNEQEYFRNTNLKFKQVSKDE